jgi:hypothetical protein
VSAPAVGVEAACDGSYLAGVGRVAEATDVQPLPDQHRQQGKVKALRCAYLCVCGGGGEGEGGGVGASVCICVCVCVCVCV